MLLLRHGESTWNVEGRWQGREDPPLSAEGERQARAAAAALADVAVVWSSDLTRARRTAELLAPSLPVRLDARLRERDVGPWAGLTRAEIDARYPGWLTDRRRPDGWEDDDVVRARCWPALCAVIARVTEGEHAVVVTHGGLIRAVVAGRGAPAWPIPNLGGVWLERVADDLALGSRVALLDAPIASFGATAAAQPD